MRKVLVNIFIILLCICLTQPILYAEDDYNLMEPSNEAVIKYQIFRFGTYRNNTFRSTTKINKYGMDFLEIEEINPNKSISKLNVKVDNVHDIWLNRRSKTDIFKVEILDNKDIIKNRFKISFNNIYDIESCSIYIGLENKLYPIKTYFEDGNLYGFIHNKNLNKFDVLVLKDQYIDETYKFRNEYYYDGLSFALESGIVPIIILKKIDDNVVIEEFSDVLDIGDYRGNINFKELYIILKNNFQDDFDIKYINRKLFQTHRKKMDFRSGDIVNYGELLYLIREIICLD